MTRKALHLLLVEDHPADVFLMETALEMSEVPHVLTVARDGREALDYLQNAVVLPDLVLLDLNMPKVNGFEVLQAVRALPQLSPLVVIVLTTSSAQMDVQRAYQLRADTYMTKPNCLHELMKFVTSLYDFCLGRAALPSTHQPV